MGAENIYDQNFTFGTNGLFAIFKYQVILDMIIKHQIGVASTNDYTVSGLALQDVRSSDVAQK